MLRRIFRGESSTSNFIKGGFSARMELSGGNLTWAPFMLDEISTEEFCVKGWVCFIEGEPYLPALFAKQT